MAGVDITPLPGSKWRMKRPGGGCWSVPGGWLTVWRVEEKSGVSEEDEGGHRFLERDRGGGG